VALSEPTIAALARDSRGILLEVTPNPAFVDEEVRICVRGLRPRSRVTIRAVAHDDEGRPWHSHAEFQADETGRINTEEDPARGGDYRGVSPMGVFWSMRSREARENGRGLFVKKDERENTMEIVVETAGRKVAQTSLVRRFIAPGTKLRELAVGEDKRGSVGRLFLPPGRGPHPAVMVLGGSGGGFDLDKAAVISRHGFAALALAYFGVPPLPNWLHRIPLEYFESALRWMWSQQEVDRERVAVLGVSRGAELALLLASSNPRIQGVVAYAPSHVVWAAGGRDKHSGEEIPTWMRGEKAVPFLPLPVRGFLLRSAIPVVGLRRAVKFRNLFRAGLRQHRKIANALIPVEKIAGPILLISGGDDRVWPAGEMSEKIVARLGRHRFVHAVEHLHYPRAGHMLRYPFLPTTPRSSRHSALRNARFAYGGTAEADAQAEAGAWRRAIAFLGEALGG
jgi:dienelactone hydrolase